MLLPTLEREVPPLSEMALRPVLVLSQVGEERKGGIRGKVQENLAKQVGGILEKDARVGGEREMKSETGERVRNILENDILVTD